MKSQAFTCTTPVPRNGGHPAPPVSARLVPVRSACAGVDVIRSNANVKPAA